LIGVAAFPLLEFPGVAVMAQMPGASAQTMATTVMAPLERHIGRIPGVQFIFSNASEGTAQIQVLFDYGRSTDDAARDVQAAINAAAADLPPGMPSPPQYFKFDTSKVPVLLVTLTSGSLPPDQLYDLTDTLLKPAVAQVDGVAQVQVGGGTPHAVRIALNANDALHTPADLATLVIASRQGVPVRLADVATIRSGQQDKYPAAWFNR